MSDKPLLLVDGSSYLYRAFHALPALTNSRGEPTGAIYGVIAMLRKLLKDYEPEQIAVVFDAKGKTFRHDLYPSYKANRPVMPSDLQKQIGPLHAMIEAMGLPLLCVEGSEADDVIATLAEQATQNDQPVIIITGDKDFAQLVNRRITLMNTMNNTHLDYATVVEKFGVTPEQFIDYLTLTGDAIDNIPGVPGVGPKTAVKWLKHYKTLDNLIEHATEIKGKVGKQLCENLQQLPLSRQLVTIKKNVPLTLSVKDLQRRSSDPEKLKHEFEMCEFKSWLKELDTIHSPDSHSTQNPQQRQDYSVIFSKQLFHRWLAQLKQAELFAIDTETTSLDVMQAELVGLSFAIHPHQAVYIPLAHDYPGAPQQLARDFVLQELKSLLEDPRKKKVGHHLKYDIGIFARYGVTLQGIAFDTMLESYLLNQYKNDMDSLAWKHLNYQTIRFEDVAGKGKQQITFNQVPIETAGQYAAEDADITLQLHHVLWPQLTSLEKLPEVLTTLEIPLIAPLSRMERHGVLIDANLLQQQSHDLARRLNELEEQAYQLAGVTFNLNSPQQLQKILFQDHHLPSLEKTATGQASTSESVLQKLAEHFPLPRVILEYRSLSKLKSTYTDKLPQQVNSVTKRIHTSYHQAAVVTGRLSSSHPNLQNIPARTAEGRKIRQAFIAPPGYKIIAADYSQIELRIMAHLAEDTGLIQAFIKGLDIHQATAAEILSIPLQAVTAEQRQNAKAINFGLFYGMSAFGLAKQLGLERKVAQNYIDNYFARYPGVQRYMEKTRQEARAQGYVKTLFGRRLLLPEINSRDALKQKASERAAINAPLQGTAADIIKKAMIQVDQQLQQTKLRAHMIMQVHDELVFEVAEQDVDMAKTMIIACMTQAANLVVPLVVDVGVGNNWNEAH